MKKALFDAIARLGKIVILGLSELSELLSIGIEKVFEFCIWIVANCFRFLLSSIDKDRVSHAEHVMEQVPINRELEILSAILKVKEDALEGKLWSETHSDALNILGNRLFNECDWEEKGIHDYMRQIVESIPGLKYAVGSDDEDEGISLE